MNCPHATLVLMLSPCRRSLLGGHACRTFLGLQVDVASSVSLMAYRWFAEVRDCVILLRDTLVSGVRASGFTVFGLATLIFRFTGIGANAFFVHVCPKEWYLSSHSFPAQYNSTTPTTLNLVNYSIRVSMNFKPESCLMYISGFV